MLTFRKMHGLGNDFVVLDGRAAPLGLTSAQIVALADRRRGIGCDQLIILEPPPPGADVFMRIHNPDGSEAGACGNATRCIADILFDEKKASRATIDTKGGFLVAEKGGERLVTVDMGAPRFDWQDIPLSEKFQDTRYIDLHVGPVDAPLIDRPSVVNVGNPHCIFWVKDLDVVDLAKIGPMLEHHPLFPRRANITLARIDARDRVVIKVWERGAGLTKACGTAACAVMAAGFRLKRLDAQATITLPGGDLFMAIRESDGHVIMTGPVEYEFEGDLPPHLAV